jgi:hypothetical protein
MLNIILICISMDTTTREILREFLLGNPYNNLPLLDWGQRSRIIEEIFIK